MGCDAVSAEEWYQNYGHDVLLARMSPTDLGSISLLPFGTTRKHLLWSLTWMIRIYAKETSECCRCHLFCTINAWLITRVTCQMMNRNYIVLFLTLEH